MGATFVFLADDKSLGKAEGHGAAVALVPATCAEFAFVQTRPLTGPKYNGTDTQPQTQAKQVEERANAKRKKMPASYVSVTCP